MKFKYDTPQAFKFFRDYYFPLWLQHGFSWQLFPDLTININVNPSSGGINSNKEHYNSTKKYIFVQMSQSKEQLEQLGFNFEQYIKVYPSSLFHEIGHHIHFTYGTPGDSEFWERAEKLSNSEIRRYFKEKEIAGHYWWIQAYEDFANYFESIIEGRKKNEAFLSWIRELIGLKAVKLTEKEYKIFKNRAYIPVRLVSEKLGSEVNWIAETREIWVLNLPKEVEK